MLSSEFVLALLQASITGAGLVLAAYALIIPLSRRFFSYRAEEINKELEELKERIRGTSTNVSADELGELKSVVENLEAIQGFPTYLSWGAGLTFFGYVASTFLCFFWLTDYNRPTADSWLPFTFLISTIFFLSLGLYSIKDISQTMKKEFEDLKKKVEETKTDINVDETSFKK